MKRPSFQFYPADWRNDAALRMCSLAARGLWWEMLGVMHTCEPYGHLMAAGRAIEPEELARIVGESAKDVRRWLAELERHVIFSRTPEGVIYSRRMVRDEVERAKWRDRQDKSRGKTENVTHVVTEESRRSSTSSSSSSSSAKEKPSLRSGSAEPSALAPPVIAIPTNRFSKTGEEVGVSQAQIDDYASTFPAVDVLQELREMRRWSVDRPERRKTAKGMSKFINGWLSREQDKGINVSRSTEKPNAHGVFFAAANSAANDALDAGKPSGGDSPVGTPGRPLLAS